jgi:hypothetical protein
MNQLMPLSTYIKQTSGSWNPELKNSGIGTNSSDIGECVGLVNDFDVKVYGILYPMRSVLEARKYLEGENTRPDLFRVVMNIPNDPNQLPKKGSKVVFSNKGDSRGHVIICVQPTVDDNNHLLGFDQWQGVTPELRRYSYENCLGWYEPIEDIVVDEAPAPVIEQPVQEVAPPASVPANTVYTRLSEPLKLIVNKDPTRKWDLSFDIYPHAAIAQEIPLGSEFLAVGKAQRTDLDRPAYFMNAEDFGAADSTGVPTNNYGINTVDLSPFSEQVAAPEQPTPEVALTTDTEKVEVKVIPSDPNKFKQTFTANLGPVQFVANRNVVVIDMEANEALRQPNKQLTRGQSVEVGGHFEKDGQVYLRTMKSIEKGAWYGIPEDALTRESDIDPDNFINDTWGKLANISKDKKTIKVIATIDGYFTRIFKRNKNKEQK